MTKEIESIEIMNSFCNLLMIIFLVTSVFDASVTYVHYTQDKDLFLLKEGNYLLNWSVKQGIPFWYSPAILINFALLGLFGFVKDKYFTKSTKVRKTLFEFGVIVLMLASVGHLYGGMSWIFY